MISNWSISWLLLPFPSFFEFFGFLFNNTEKSIYQHCANKIPKFPFLSRASIWWKYLDRDSVLPPPFTGIYFLHKGIGYLINKFKKCQSRSQKASSSNNPPDDTNADRRKREMQDEIDQDKREFEKRYRNLMLALISPQSHASQNGDR